MSLSYRKEGQLESKGSDCPVFIRIDVLLLAFSWKKPYHKAKVSKGESSMEPITVQHTFSPIFDKNSCLLILGTVPSVKSRENDFYYGHPQNRFWKLIAILCGEKTPVTKEEKTEMLLRHGIALYDVVERCTIVGSSDSSIKDVVPVDLTPILEQTGNIPIFANGATAEKLYRKYLFPKTGISAVKLPSTSPANAAWSLSRLEEAWREAMEPYLG